MLKRAVLLLLFVGLAWAQQATQFSFEQLNKYFQDTKNTDFTGQLYLCKGGQKDDYMEELQVHHIGKPTPYVTTRKTGLEKPEESIDLVDPYRQSALYHEYVLVGPGLASSTTSNREVDEEDSEGSSEEIRLYIYDEEGLHDWEVGPNIKQHKLAMKHVWSLVNATGMLPSMTVSNTTFKRTFRFHADKDDMIAYHLSYPQLFQSREPVPPMDVLVEFPANTRTMRTLKTVINYQTFSLYRWRLSPAPLVKDPRYTALAMRADTVTFHNYCNEYVVGYITKETGYEGFSRFMKCVFQRRLKRVDNPCVKDMFLNYVILNYARGLTRSTSDLMISVPMVHDVAQQESQGWMNMTDVYCPGDIDPDECGEPLDVVLTNDHLLILTDKGIWVSSSLNATNANASMPYVLKPLLKFSPIDPCAYLPGFNCSEVGAPILGHNVIRRHRLFYTPVCHLYQYPSYDDIVIYVIEHVTQTSDMSEEVDVFTVMYSPKPYAEWEVLFNNLSDYTTSDGTFPIKEIVGIFFNHHRRQFDVSLVIDENGKDRTFRFVLPELERGPDAHSYTELSGLLGKGFLEFEFPSTFYMTHLEVNPETMDVFFLGQEVWIAESAGAFVYLSVPVVKDHLDDLSRVETCSFNHPDRSFVCSELTHAELYVGRVGVSYSPVEIEYKSIEDIKYTSLYRYWPMPYLSYIGLIGNFIASYAGKVLLWFSPDYFVLYKSLKSVKKKIDGDTANNIDPIDCDSETSEESPVPCLLCKKLKELDKPQTPQPTNRRTCDTIDLEDTNNLFITSDHIINVEFPFGFEMLAFDPTHFKTRDTHTDGPLVPFPIDGDKVVVFEAEVPFLEKNKPERHYLNDINVGNVIICTSSEAKGPQELQADASRRKSCNEGRDSDVSSNCELYIRHMKNLKREGKFGFLQGFRRAFYATVVSSFPTTPIPSELLVMVLPDSNIAFVQLNNVAYSNRDQAFTFDYSHVGMTLYIPDYFSILLLGFPKYKECEAGANTPPGHDLTRMQGYATRYYRQGLSATIVLKAYLIQFQTMAYCDYYKGSVKSPEFEHCKITKGDILAVGFKDRIEKTDMERQNLYKLHKETATSVFDFIKEDLHSVYSPEYLTLTELFDPLDATYWDHYEKMEDDTLTLWKEPRPDQRNQWAETTTLIIEDQKTTPDKHHLEYERPRGPLAQNLLNRVNFPCRKNNWNIVDGGCHFQLVLQENRVIKQNGGRISLDKHDSISFVVKLRALTPLGKSLIHRPLMVVSNSNPAVLLVERQESIGKDPQTMKITLTPTGVKKGVASVTVRPIIVSTHCVFSDGGFTVIVQVHRAEGRRLHINYPVPICKPLPNDKQYPRPWKIDLPSCVKRKELTNPAKAVVRRPRQTFGDVFYSALPKNYRPPSHLGKSVPISKNVYNVDPQAPKYKDWYRISQESHVYKKCRGARNVKECHCSENDKLSDDVEYSDCKRMVYTVKRGFKVDISVEYDRLMQDKDQNTDFFSPKRNWTVYLEEVNERREYTVNSIKNEYMRVVEGSSSLKKDEDRVYYDSQSLSVTPHGMGLFHFKVTLGHFDSFDEVTGFFMIYAPDDDLNHIQLMTIMLLTITICMIFVFVGFLIVRKRLIAQLPFQVREKHRIQLE